MSDELGLEKELTSLLDLTAEIVAAYVSNNSVPHVDLGGLIATVHGAVTRISSGQAVAPVEAPQEPAVPVKKSVTKDFIICLEDGKKFKSLRRHLSAAYGLTPDTYRAKWGLPADYPMVAPNYSATRSELAKAAGLGVGVGRSAEKSTTGSMSTSQEKRSRPTKSKAA